MAYVDSASYEGRYFRFTVNQSGTSTTVSWKLEVLGGTELYYATSPINCYINGANVCSYAATGWSAKKFPVAKGSVSDTYNVGKYGTFTIILSGRPYYNSATSKSSTVTLTAPTYTISYNANGGTGAPSNQTKTYNTTLKLSTTIPTRESIIGDGFITHYVFKGWSTSDTATTAEYTAGGDYTKDEAATLYAVWEVVIQNISIDRPSTLLHGISQNYIKFKLIPPSSFSDDATFGSWDVTTTSGTYKVSNDILTVKWDKNETILAYIRVIDSKGFKSDTIEVVCNVRKNGFCMYDKGRWKKVSPYVYRDGEYKRLNGAVYNENTSEWLKHTYRGSEVTYASDESGSILTDEFDNILEL